MLELEVPSHKLVGDEATLECRYVNQKDLDISNANVFRFDMESDRLYSVKWYRNEQEFYRFVPNDRPKLQIFPQNGIRVEV